MLTQMMKKSVWKVPRTMDSLVRKYLRGPVLILIRFNHTAEAQPCDALSDCSSNQIEHLS
jgi:hypothetical protein